jgi:hypothetical protein
MEFRLVFGVIEYIQLVTSLRTDRTENAAYISSSIVVCVSVAADTCLSSRYPAEDNFFWLHYSRFQVSCHNTLRFKPVFLHSLDDTETSAVDLSS